MEIGIPFMSTEKRSLNVLETVFYPLQPFAALNSLRKNLYLSIKVANKLTTVGHPDALDSKPRLSSPASEGFTEALTTEPQESVRIEGLGRFDLS